MTHVTVGDICLTGRSHRLALVIFRREPSEGRPEDVRVVPLSAAATAPPATDRDVLIPAEATPFGQLLIAQSWNARSLVSQALSIPIGHVEQRVVDAVRTAEMIGIAPGIDTSPYSDLIGQHRESERDVAAIAAFEDAEVEAWNLIELAYLDSLPASPGEVYGREMYEARKQVGAATVRSTAFQISSVELPMVYQPTQPTHWIVADELTESDAMTLATAA